MKEESEEKLQTLKESRRIAHEQAKEELEETAVSSSREQIVIELKARVGFLIGYCCCISPFLILLLSTGFVSIPMSLHRFSLSGFLRMTLLRRDKY